MKCLKDLVELSHLNGRDPEFVLAGGGNTSPKIIALEKQGLFAWGVSKKNADTALAMFLDYLKISVYAESFGGPRAVPEKQVEFIRNWEAEAHRRRVSGSGDSLGRGCTPEDVTRAVFYLVEQEYETGQALPITGG